MLLCVRACVYMIMMSVILCTLESYVCVCVYGQMGLLDVYGCDSQAVYQTLFDPSVNPVSTVHGFLKIIEDHVSEGSTILDVGIGAGMYLADERVHRVFRDKNLTLHGIDIDVSAINGLQKSLEDPSHPLFGLATCSVQDLTHHTERYDVVLYMESFPVIPRGVMMTYLEHTDQNLLRPAGRILMYHNLSKSPSRVIEFVKPLAKYLVQCDFGRQSKLSDMDGLIPGKPVKLQPLLEYSFTGSEWSAGSCWTSDLSFPVRLLAFTCGIVGKMYLRYSPLHCEQYLCVWE